MVQVEENGDNLWTSILNFGLSKNKKFACLDLKKEYDELLQKTVSENVLGNIEKDINRTGFPLFVFLIVKVLTNMKHILTNTFYNFIGLRLP